MPHYHFHVMHGGPVLYDAAGTDLPNIGAVLDYALRLVRGPVSEAMTIIDRSPGWQVEVMDEDKTLVLLVPFPYRPAGRT